jgi:hypothetical protein
LFWLVVVANMPKTYRNGLRLSSFSPIFFQVFLLCFLSRQTATGCDSKKITKKTARQ